MLALATIVLILWVLSFGRTLLNLTLVRRISAAAPATSSPSISVVIPARNEAAIIGRTVRALLASHYPDFEVIVVNDRSTDGTGDVLASIDDARLVAITGAEPPDGWLGKPWALHQGAARARGELLLFVDADVIYEPDALRAAANAFTSSGVELLSLFPRFEMETLAEKLAMPQLAITAFCVLPTWFANRTRIGALAIGGGPGNLLRRARYDEIGGHAALRDAVVDDVALARLVRRAGYRTEFVRADHLIHLRMYAGLRDIIEGFTKNMFAVFGRSVIGAVLALLAFAIGNVMPFLLVFAAPPLGRIALATVIAIAATRALLFRSLRYGLVNAILGHPFMTTLWTYIFLRSIWITGVKRELRWRGRKYDAAKTRFG